MAKDEGGEEWVRPWCCPEPRCTVLYHYNVWSPPQPGESFACFGVMDRAVEFVYDGKRHKNDLNHCDYTPLKGVVRWQDNEDDWIALERMYAMARRKLAALTKMGATKGD
jgi:hypothetical protein